jgi:hypothetical protein
MLVLDGLLQLLVWLFYQIYTKTIEMPLQGSELPLALGNDYFFHPLGVYIRKHRGTCQGHAGLG